MWKKHQLLMIPTKSPSNLGFLTKKGKEVFNDLRFFEKELPTILDSENQHLYVISEEKIKENDWFIGFADGSISPFIKKANNSTVEINNWQLNKKGVSPNKKIIATTNKDLNLPQIPQSFIEEFVEEYNNNNVIKEVFVEYEGIEWGDKPLQYFVKINANNTINIFQKRNNFHSNNRDEDANASWGFGGKKTSWNKKEVVNLINKFEKDTFPLRYEGYPTEQEDIDIWIKNNL